MNYDENIYAEVVFDGIETHTPARMGTPKDDQLQGTAAERLVELAGRVCYDSLGKGRSSAAYHAHIAEVGHGSVWEHANFTVEFRSDMPGFFAELSALCLNRPGVWLESTLVPKPDGVEGEPSMLVTLNLRAVVEWEEWRSFDTPNQEAIDHAVSTCANAVASQVVTDAQLSAMSEYVGTAFSFRLVPADEVQHAEGRWVSLLLGGSRGMCYDAETEVLTGEGWKPWPDVRGDELFATLNVCTESLEYQEATAIIREPHHGRMYEVRSQFVNLVVTPEHRMVVRPHDTQAARRGEQELVIWTAEEVMGRRVHYKRTARWEGGRPRYFTIPSVDVQARIVNGTGVYGTRTIVCKGRKVDAFAFAKFVGYWLAEGSLDHTHGGGYQVVLTQNRGGRAWDGMLACLETLGWSYREVPVGTSVQLRVNGGKALYDYLRPHSGAANKSVPRELLQWGRRYQRALIRAYLEGDGSFAERASVGEGHTVSKRLAGDLQEAALKAGWSASVREVDRRGEDGPVKHRRIVHVVGFAQDRGCEPLVNHGGKTHDRWTHYSGMVYCVSVPNGTLYVRRGGKPCWSGNSHEQVRHKFRTAVSQRSTRYVDESDSPWVEHPLTTKILRPAVDGDRKKHPSMVKAGEGQHAGRTAYIWVHEALESLLLSKGIDRHAARKQARGAARGYLGNALHTELIFSASVAQWRRMVEQRCSRFADAEIRVMYGHVLRALKTTKWAEDFEDIRLVPSPDGIGKVAEFSSL